MDKVKFLRIPDFTNDSDWTGKPALDFNRFNYATTLALTSLSTKFLSQLQQITYSVKQVKLVTITNKHESQHNHRPRPEVLQTNERKLTIQARTL